MNYGTINSNYVTSTYSSQVYGNGAEDSDTQDAGSEDFSSGNDTVQHPGNPNYVQGISYGSDDSGQGNDGSNANYQTDTTEYEAELGFVPNSAGVTAGTILTVDTVPKDDSWRQTANEFAPNSQELDSQSTSVQSNEVQSSEVTTSQPQTTDGTVQGTGDENPPVTGPRTLAPGQFPPGDPNPALIEAGRVHVDALKGAGTLDESRANTILADEGYLQLIGDLLAEPGSETDRAVEVLISDTGGSSGPADRYLSGLARNGAISLDEFKALANDIDFLGTLLPLFPDPNAAAPTSPQADEQMLIRLGGAELGNGHQGYIGADGLIIQNGEQAQTQNESHISVNGSTTVEQPEPLPEDAITTPHYITADGQPFPPEFQTRLDEAKAAGGPDPATLRAAQVLTGTVEALPVEQFLGQAYMGGRIDLDTYIKHLSDPDFLNKPEHTVAAEVLLGVRQDHSASDDFMNKIFADGHISFDQYIRDVNNPDKMAALDRGVAEGELVYESDGFGSADAVLAHRSEDEIKSILHPGVNLNEGPPSAEQIAALHQLSEGRDQRFVELTTQWVLHHNPGYALQFGHPTQEAKDAGEPVTFFWTNNGQKIDDPFLNSLTGELSSPDGRLHFDDGTAEEFEYGDGERFEDDLMVEVRIKYEGVTDKDDDELTDHSRWLEPLIYAHEDPGEMDNLKNRLKSTDGIPIGIDDHYEGDYPAGGSGGKARAALGAIDPALTDGVQINWVKGKDGVQIGNPTQFDKTVVYVEESKNVHFTGNNGPLTFLAYDHENVTATTGSGEAVAVDQSAPIVQSTADPNVPKIKPERSGFLEGVVHGAVNVPENEQAILAIMNSPEPLTAVVQSDSPVFAGLEPEERLYVYDKASQQIATSPTNQENPAGTTPGGNAPADPGTTTSNFANTSPDSLAPEHQQYIEQDAQYLLQETASLAPAEAIAVIDQVADTDQRYSPAEGEYLKAYARQQLGLASSSPNHNTTTVGNNTTPDVDTSGRQADLNHVATAMYEHFGSVEDVAFALDTDPELQAYPLEERQYILTQVVELDAQADSNRQSAVEDYEMRKQENAEENNLEWDQIAIAAKNQYTINGDEFDTDAFVQAVENEDTLLPTREAKDYVIETTLRFAENGNLTLL